MERIFNALMALIKLASENLVAALIVCVTLLGLGIALVFWKNMQYIVEHFPKPAKEKEQLERQITADTLVQETLDEMVSKIQCDRIGIHQFTNGVRDMSGLPFAYSELRFLAMRKGVAMTADMQPGRGASKMPLSNFNDLLKNMWRPGLEPTAAKMFVEEFKNPTMYNMMTENGSDVIYATPILNIRKMPVGIMVATYLDRAKPSSHNISDEQIQENLAEKAQDIAGYLLAVSSPKKPWLWFPPQ